MIGILNIKQPEKIEVMQQLNYVKINKEVLIIKIIEGKNESDFTK